MRCGKKRCFPVSDPSDPLLCPCAEITSIWRLFFGRWTRLLACAHVTKICFIFLYAFFYVTVWHEEANSSELCVCVCLRAPNVYICILSHLGEGPEREYRGVHASVWTPTFDCESPQSGFELILVFFFCAMRSSSRCCRLLKGNGVLNKRSVWKKHCEWHGEASETPFCWMGLQLLDDGVLMPKFMIINNEWRQSREDRQNDVCWREAEFDQNEDDAWVRWGHQIFHCSMLQIKPLNWSIVSLCAGHGLHEMTAENKRELLLKVWGKRFE